MEFVYSVSPLITGDRQGDPSSAASRAAALGIDVIKRLDDRPIPRPTLNASRLLHVISQLMPRQIPLQARSRCVVSVGNRPGATALPERCLASIETERPV